MGGEDARGAQRIEWKLHAQPGADGRQESTLVMTTITNRTPPPRPHPIQADMPFVLYLYCAVYFCIWTEDDVYTDNATLLNAMP
jgi:hypothetical protein